MSKGGVASLCLFYKIGKAVISYLNPHSAIRNQFFRLPPSHFPLLFPVPLPVNFATYGKLLPLNSGLGPVQTVDHYEGKRVNRKLFLKLLSIFISILDGYIQVGWVGSVLIGLYESLARYLLLENLNKLSH